MDALGMQCLQKKEYEQALWFFEKKLQLDPDNSKLQELIRSTKVKINPNLIPKEEAQDVLINNIMTETDYYKMLGIPSDSTEATITKRYRQIALLIHPDKNKDPRAPRAFALLKKAFEVLCKADQRSLYDTFGEAGMRQRESSIDVDGDLGVSVSASSVGCTPLSPPSRLKPGQSFRGRLSICVGDDDGVHSPSSRPGTASKRSPLTKFTEAVLENPLSESMQAEQFERQAHQRARRASTFRMQKEKIVATHCSYEPPRDLNRQWQRQQTLKEIRESRREQVEKRRVENLNQQYDQMMKALQLQKQKCMTMKL